MERGARWAKVRGVPKKSDTTECVSTREFKDVGGGHQPGRYCEIIVMYDTGILDLDHENDFELMQVIAKHLYETKPEFAEVYEHLLK